jgi:hypothetical protein
MRLCTYGRRSLVKSGSRRRRSTTPGYADVMQALSELGIDVAAATFPSNVRRDARQQMTSAFSDVSR